MRTEVLDEVIKRLGNQAQLARICGVTPPAVTQWLKRGQIPATRCKTVEKATGIKRKDLRPDIFK